MNLTKGLHNQVLVLWKNLHNETYQRTKSLDQQIKKPQTQPVKIQRLGQYVRHNYLEGSLEPRLPNQAPIDNGTGYRRLRNDTRDGASLKMHVNGWTVGDTKSEGGVTKRTGSPCGPSMKDPKPSTRAVSIAIVLSSPVIIFTCYLLWFRSRIASP